MKNILFAFVFLTMIFDGALAATTNNARGRTTTMETAQQVARRATQVQTVASRGAVPQVSQTAVQQRGRATTTTPTTTAARARAAKTQSVVNSGTKVVSAAQNTLVDEECQNKFNGCMDSFCMIDNANGGRCMCSDRNSELDSILAEIQKLDAQSYEMATAGVERINMGEDVAAVTAKTEAITKSITGQENKSKRDLLDLSDWNALNVDFNDLENIFAETEEDISKQTGDKLYRTAADMCMAQIPECSGDFSMLESMYKQRVRSDCMAYENSLKQQRTQSAQKLAAAQNALREAALEQYRTANKYDLGQCTYQFKQCMQTTAGCGEDFSGCVSYDYTNKKLKGKKAKLTKIQGSLTTIEIAASTYDILESKKPMCMDVTQSCVAVRDQVWDTFLREAAPELKSAELIAESDLRSSCISNISKCFQKACKDNIDPNDPDGSYDLCLTRPDTFRSLCKVEIEPCEAMDGAIMESVYALLAAMRVDSCTAAFKSCLQSEDRCGSDYTQCVGLDADSIVGLCPVDKLAACRYERDGKTVKTADELYTELTNIAQGIFLSIDDQLLTKCQNAANSAMVKACGGASGCDAFSDDGVIGTQSLISYKNNDNATVIDGLLNFKLISLKQQSEGGSQKITYSVDVGDYKNLFENHSSEYADTIARIKSAIESLENDIKQKLDIIATDPVVDMCINGRNQNWRYTGKRNATNDGDVARFPHLLDSYAADIFKAAVTRATENYDEKYNNLVADAVKGQSDAEKAAMCQSLTTEVTDMLVPVEGIDIRYVLGVTTTSDGDNGAEQLLDSQGNHVGTIVKTAVYSPATAVCTITTITTTCKSNTSYQSVCVKYEPSATGIGETCAKWGTEIVYTACTKWNDPVKTVQEIQM